MNKHTDNIAQRSESGRWRGLLALTTVLALVSAGVLLAREAPAQSAQVVRPELLTAGDSVMVHFESLTAGDSVEGLGAVHPLLEITALNGAGIVIETGDVLLTQVTYGAPQIGNQPDGAGPGPSRFNNCLEDASGNRVNVNISAGATAKGFGDAVARAAGSPEDFRFTFAPGVKVNDFSIRMFDFGDFNPGRSANHTVTLTAYDSFGQFVDADVLSYNSSTALAPRSSDFGDLLATGDACDAAADLSQPGYWEFRVADPSGARTIARVELITDPAGADPNGGYDSIVFDALCTRTIGYWKNHSWDGAVVRVNADDINEATGRESIAGMKDGMLWKARGNNFSLLWAQLIAAKLNCGVFDCTGGSIDAAELFLASSGIGVSNFDDAFANKTQKRRANELANVLDLFNNMFHCRGTADPVPLEKTPKKAGGNS